MHCNMHDIIKKAIYKKEVRRGEVLKQQKRMTMPTEPLFHKDPDMGSEVALGHRA